jgi:hypothetical protein
LVAVDAAGAEVEVEAGLAAVALGDLEVEAVAVAAQVAVGKELFNVRINK